MLASFSISFVSPHADLFSRFSIFNNSISPQCDAADEKCVRCKNSFRLYDGTCFEECPPGTVEQGGGRFNRYCQDAASP